jgi:hypothetical protein
LFIFLAFLLGLGVFFNASAQVNSDPKFAPWNPLVWLEQKVTASDGTANSYFGSAAALNGSTALIGADGDNSFQGAAYLFTKSNGSWSQGQKLTASDGLAGDEFGYRVVLADDTLLVGAFTATVGGVVSQGAAYVFTQSNGTWSESQKLTASDGGLCSTTLVPRWRSTAARSWSVQMVPLSAATPPRARSMFSPSRTALGRRRRNSQPMMVPPTITSASQSRSKALPY